MPLHYQHDFRPCLAYLRTPPLRFGRRPPQSNCLPCTVPRPDNGRRLEPQTNQGGISTTAPRDLAAPLQSLPPILHRSVHSPMQSYSKGSWGLSVLPRGDCIITNISTSLSLGRRQCGHRYAIRAGRNLPDKEFRSRLLLPNQVSSIDSIRGTGHFCRPLHVAMQVGLYLHSSRVPGL